MLVWAAGMLGLLIGIFGGFYVFLLSAMRVGRKGYLAGTGGSLILAALSIGIAISFWWFFTAGAYFNPDIVTLLTPVFLFGVPSVTLSLLPRRKPKRSFSAQRVVFPYAKAIRIVLVTGGSATAVSVPVLSVNSIHIASLRGAVIEVEKPAQPLCAAHGTSAAR